jgi:hypothetical protein
MVSPTHNMLSTLTETVALAAAGAEGCCPLAAEFGLIYRDDGEMGFQAQTLFVPNCPV